MKPDSLIRPLSADDLPSVAALEQQLFSHPWNLSRFETALQAGYLILGCEVEQQLVGYVVISHGGGVADLLTIGIDPGVQGAGEAQRLLKTAIETLRRFEVEELLLEVRASNKRAIGFYLKTGFEQVGVRKHYYPSSSGREDAWVFKRRLASP